MEKKQRVYIETSFISYLDAPEHINQMVDTLQLWEQMQAGKHEVVVSEQVMAELEKCREPKRTFMFNELRKIEYDLISCAAIESKRIVDQYIRLGELPRESGTDAVHIALATLAGCDVIVSWNFAHIANVNTIIAVHTVNKLEGLKRIHIVSPQYFPER
jgi:predicted nucleic acid-binding protein